MLHIPFAELMRGGAQQMLAREGRFGMHQRHHVLQLVAESVGPAGLIKPGAAPQPATQGLIQQPAVGQHVHGRIGSFDLHRAEGSLPILPDSFQRRAAGVGAAKATNQGLHFRRAPTDAEAKTDLAFLPGRQIASDLHRAAGIQTGAHFSGKPRALERRRMRQASVPAEKLLPISREGARRPR